MEKIVVFRKSVVVLIAFISIILLSSCIGTGGEKKEKVDVQNIIDDQTERIVVVDNKEFIVLTSIIGNRLTFDYKNLQRNYDIESSIDFFIRGNKSKFSSTYYRAYENGEIFFEINELTGNQLELSVINAKGIFSDIVIGDLRKSMYYKGTEYEIMEDNELVLGVVIFSSDEKSLEQADKISWGNIDLDEVITEENYVFILKSKFESSEEKK